jgi:hypothetical protein
MSGYAFIYTYSRLKQTQMWTYMLPTYNLTQTYKWTLN